MSATAAASASEIVVDFHEKNGQPPPPPVDNASEFKSSNTTNNLWLDFFGAADQVGYLIKYKYDLICRPKLLFPFFISLLLAN